MKSLILEPTDKNILATFEKDTFKRLPDICYFTMLLNSIDGPYSIALDGKWGSGKIFFVKHTELVFNAFNPLSTVISDDDKKIVKELLNNCGFHEDFNPQLTVYYDAWSNDNDIDPILSIISCIEKSVNIDFKEKYSIDNIKLLSAIFKLITNRDIENVFKAVSKSDIVKSLKKEKEVQESINNYIKSVLQELGKRLIIFIDELDRCKPSYAVCLLERIKHYFNNGDVTFVFSTNLEQLQHTIKHFYGDSIDACGYLERFFDFSISLPPIDKRIFYDLLHMNDSSLFDLICKVIINKYNFEFREAVKFYTLANIALHNKTHSGSRAAIVPTEYAYDFCLKYIVPILLGLKIKDETGFKNFIEGNDVSPLCDILDNKEYFYGHFDKLLDDGETFDSTSDKERLQVKLADKLTKVYFALFKHDYSYNGNIVSIGSLSFTNETKNSLMKVISTLSGYANYNV